MSLTKKRSIGILVLVVLALVVALPTPASAHRGGWWVSAPYWGYGAWGWGGWGWGWGGGPYGYTVVYPMADRTHGALDIDVAPERAEVFIDGERVGTADDFDGFPDYLWLEKGTYDVVIFHPGYQTVARQISIYAGQVIDVDDRMTPGQETRPEDLVSKSTVNRDERLRRDRENEEEVRRWEAEDQRREEEASIDARGEPGRAWVRVSPDDASVYLDGRFLGTARELSRLRSGLIVDAGEHRIEAVRPGLEPAWRGFSVEPGEEIEVRLELTEED
jgi:hypothetical protein